MSCRNQNECRSYDCELMCRKDVPILTGSDARWDKALKETTPQTTGPKSLPILGFPTKGLPSGFSVIGSRQITDMSFQVRDCLLLTWKEPLPQNPLIQNTRHAYFALTSNGQEWEYVSEYVKGI